MSISCPLSYLVSNINVAIKHKRPSGTCINSKLNRSVLEKLSQLKIIENYYVESCLRLIKFKVRFMDKQPIIGQIKRISKPGRRIYEKAAQLKSRMIINYNGLVSTSQGIMTITYCIHNKIGGEVLLVYT